MRNYQPHLNNPYWLPTSLYRRTLALIRDYDRMKETRDEIPDETSGGDGGGGSGSGDRTGSRAVRIAIIADDIRAIDRALELVPEEYREGVWASVQHYAAYPDDADKRTYSRHKSRFIYQVARNKGWIQEA